MLIFFHDVKTSEILKVYCLYIKAFNFLKGKDPVTITVWDVEGGYTNAVISQTLFTPNTIYVLVWDADNASIEEIPAWLLNVKVIRSDNLMGLDLFVFISSK